jgi:hypothetical protein
MEKPAGKGLFIGYVVIAILFAAMMFFSASSKLTLHPGAVQIIHETIGIPLALFPVLAACEIAGGIGLLAGIFRPKLGVAGAIGLVLYFVGAIVSHIAVGDWAGLKSPIMPLVLSCAALALRLLSMRRA